MICRPPIVYLRADQHNSPYLVRIQHVYFRIHPTHVAGVAQSVEKVEASRVHHASCGRVPSPKPSPTASNLGRVPPNVLE